MDMAKSTAKSITLVCCERGAATGDEVADRDHDVFPLPLGMKREDRCE